MAINNSAGEIVWTSSLAYQIREAHQKRLAEVIRGDQQAGSISDEDLAVLRHDETSTEILRAEQTISAIDKLIMESIKKHKDTSRFNCSIEYEAEITARLIIKSFGLFYALTGSTSALCAMLKDIYDRAEDPQMELELFSESIKIFIDMTELRTRRINDELKDL